MSPLPPPIPRDFGPSRPLTDLTKAEHRAVLRDQAREQTAVLYEIRHLLAEFMAPLPPVLVEPPPAPWRDCDCMACKQLQVIDRAISKAGA